MITAAVPAATENLTHMPHKEQQRQPSMLCCQHPAQGLFSSCRQPSPCSCCSVQKAAAATTACTVALQRSHIVGVTLQPLPDLMIGRLPLSYRAFWLWLCDGLTVKDALVIVVWAAYNAVWYFTIVTKALVRVPPGAPPPPRFYARSFATLMMPNVVPLMLPVARWVG